MVGKELIQGIPASAPARLQARLSARRLLLALPLHRVLRYAQKTLALRETPRHLAALGLVRVNTTRRHGSFRAAIRRRPP
jgi:hypothetical protein